MAQTNAERQKQFKDRQSARQKELEQKVADLEGVIASISCLLANRKDPKTGKQQIEAAFKLSSDAIDGMDWTPRADIFDADQEEANGETAVRLAEAAQKIVPNGRYDY